MKKLYFLIFTILISAASFGQVINEVDADTPGTDAAEYIEILWTPNTSLDGLVVVLFNGSDDASYLSFDLDGFSTDANGFFILGNTAIISPGDLEVPPGGSGAIQNGADAVALLSGNGTDFPNDTPISPLPMGTTLLSGVVYDTNDGDDAALLTAIGGVQYDEDENGAKDTQSVQRNMDGTYTVKNTTFRAANDAAVCDLALAGESASCDAITAGTDTYTATVDFSGGGTSTYTVSADVGTVDLSAGDPSSDATGTITVNNVPEGTDVTITVQDGGLCDLNSTITGIDCVPPLTLPFLEDFSYADGFLTSNPNWSEYSGTALQMAVVSGAVEILNDGSLSEDVRIEFTPIGGGDVFYSIDFSVNNPGAPVGGGDYEYFACFKNDGFGLSGRVDIVEPNAGGDFSVGLSTIGSSADVTWATDLNFDTTYTLTVRFNLDDNISELWIDATSQSDPSITSNDEAGGGIAVQEFALRQANSSTDETIIVDNLRIASTFNEVVLSTNSFDETSFALYPNPTNTGSVSIVSNQSNIGKLNIAVYDILGKQVINTQMRSEKLDVSSLNTGVYIMKITQGEATSTKKLVIN